MRTFITEQEFLQTSLETTVRLLFDRASQILSEGNPVHDYCNSILLLSNLATNNNLSNTTINFYYETLNDENSKNEFMAGWSK